MYIKGHIYDGSFWYLTIFDTPPLAAANPPFTDMLDMFSSSGTLFLCVNMYLSWRDICMMISGLHLEKKENGRGRGHPCLSWPGSISFSSNLPDLFEGLIHHYCHESYGLIRFRTDIYLITFALLIALQFYMDINTTPMVDFKCVKDRHDMGLYVK